MNEHMNAKQRGELMAGLGFITVLLGLGFLGFGTFVERPRYERLRTEGKSVDAWVTGLRVETRKSRRSQSTNNWVDVEFASADAKPFVMDPAALPKPANPIDRIAFGYLQPKGKTDAKSSLNVSHDVYQALSLSSRIEVTFLDDERDEAVETARVRRYSPWPMFSAGLIISLVGGALVTIGWRRRAAG